MKQHGPRVLSIILHVEDLLTSLNIRPPHKCNKKRPHFHKTRMTRNQRMLSYNILFIAKVSNHDGNPSWEPTSSDGKFTREGNMVGGGLWEF